MTLFGIFGSDSGSEEVANIRVSENKYSKYTVSLGEAEFVDGDTKRFMFDSIQRKGGTITLYEYTSFDPPHSSRKPFISIESENLKTFEVVRREKVRVFDGKNTRQIGPLPFGQAKDVAEKLRQNKNVENVEVLK